MGGSLHKWYQDEALMEGKKINASILPLAIDLREIERWKSKEQGVSASYLHSSSDDHKTLSFSSGRFRPSHWNPQSLKGHENSELLLPPNMLEFYISVHTMPRMVPYQYLNDNCYCRQTHIEANFHPNFP
ncbi:hypothetical protein AAC387_Pa03g1646 [Persea americana]